MSGQHWKKALAARKGSKPSRTPGKLKGDTCKASPLQKFMAKASRSRNHPDYSKWCARMDSINKKAGV